MSKPKIPGVGVPSPIPPSTAPLYEASQPTFVNGRMYAKGEQFRSNEKPSRTWRLVEAGKPVATGKRGKDDKAAQPPAQPADGGGDEPL